MTLKQQFIKLAPLVLIVAGLLSYNFMSAQWAGPQATAPLANAPAPINLSANYQAKLGDLGAVRMRAGQYCNAAGTSCISPGNWSCPSGQALSRINPNGTVVCTSISGGTSPSCTQRVETINNGCPGPLQGRATCPAGTTIMRTYTVPVSWCAGDEADVHNMIDCLRLVCT